MADVSSYDRTDEKKPILVAVILCVTLGMGIPNYSKWVKKDIVCKQDIEAILEATNSMVHEDMLLTNSEHL